MRKNKHIAIIGAGPAGLMVAEMLATTGHRVTLYDRMPTPARKFLMAGRGGLNLTHSEPLPQFLTRYGAAHSWLQPAIEAFTPTHLRAWCEGLGEETYVGSSGRVFPRQMKAAPLLRAWMKRLEALGAQYFPRHDWQGWNDAGALRFAAPHGEVLCHADATLFALGGASWPKLGADGGWQSLMRARGVEVAPLRPANCGFVVPWSAYFAEHFAGQPLKPMAVHYDGLMRQGEAMITAQGVEGGVFYALSAPLRDGIEAYGTAEIFLDLRPDMPLETLSKKLGTRRAGQSFATYAKKAGFSSLVVSLLREVKSAAWLADATATELAACLKAVPLKLTATAGMVRAISSAGGITQAAVNGDYMLHAMPSVFVAGEMLDWEAPTGGYLLQGCFSTAVAASKGIERYLNAH